MKFHKKWILLSFIAIILMSFQPSYADTVFWGGTYSFMTPNGTYIRIYNPQMSGLNITGGFFPEFAIDYPFNLSYDMDIGSFGASVDNITILTSEVKFKLLLDMGDSWTFIWYNFSSILVNETLTPLQNETTVYFRNLIIPSTIFPREMYEYLEEEWTYPIENKTGSIGWAEFYFGFTAIENPLNDWGYGIMNTSDYGWHLYDMNYYYEWYYTPSPYPYYSSPNTLLWFGIGMGAGFGIGALVLFLIKRRK